MAHRPNSNHDVRTIVLPSGRKIEVVYFADPDSAGVPPATPTRRLEDLHICVECQSPLVYPTEWEETSSTHWEVVLRCPECLLERTGNFNQEAVDSFDEELDRGTEELVRSLKRVTRANMEEEADRLAAALEANAVWPMDFDGARCFGMTAYRYS